MSTPRFTSAGYLARNATITTVGRGLGVATGLALDAAIVALFGVSHETDAYFAALAIPFLISSTVEMQAPKILVPFFTQAFQTRGRPQAWALLRSVMLLAGLLFAACAMLLSTGARLIVPLQVPGLDPAGVALAVRLAQLLAWIVLVQGLSTVVAGALYADHHYFTTTTSRMTMNGVTIAAAGFGFHAVGIYSLAIGLLLGSIAQLMSLLVAAHLRGFRFGRASLSDPELSRLFLISVYPLLGQTLGGATVLLENFLGSLVGPGALSLLRYANRVISAVAGVLVGGVLTTSLPMLSHYAADRNYEEMKGALLKTIRFVALLAVPVSLWLVFAAGPLVALVFERGRFMPADTARLALLLTLLSPYVLFSRVAGVTEVAFYATKDTRTPLWAIAAFLGCYGLVCWIAIPVLGMFAFPVATSCGALLAAGLLVHLAERRFGSLPWAGSRDFGRRLTIVACVSVVGFLLGMGANQFILAASPIAKVAHLIVVTSFGFSGFLGSAIVVRLVDWRHLVSVFRDATRSGAMTASV